MIQTVVELYALKNGRLIHEDMSDEYFMQIFRQMNRKNKQQNEKIAKTITNCLQLMAVLSRYHVPSKDLMEGYENWLQLLKEDM
jgi:hypothetical protein